jgi:hypothetical protein
LFSYLLAAFAICTALMLILSFSNFFESRWSMPSASSQVVHAQSSTIPVAIPAPLPPAEQLQVSTTALPESANPVPQTVPVPVPSVP